MIKQIVNKTLVSTFIPSDWKISKLAALGKFSKGKGILKEQVIENGLPCVRYGEIYTTHNFIIKEFSSFISDEVAAESQEIKDGDILFAGSGETIEDIGKSVAYIGNEKAFAGGDVIILSTNKDIEPECLSYALETDFVRKQKRRFGQGQQVVHIYPSDLAKIKVLLPPLPEQKAIAQVLSTWDKAIETTQKLIDQKELRKKWLMQVLLTGEKRLNGYSEDWKQFTMNDVFKRITRKNIERNTNVVTISAQRGFIKQTDFFNKTVASETLDNYFLVVKGEFCYNKSYSNGYAWGATKRLKDFDKAVVTTLYICFGLKNENHFADFFEYFFEANLLDKGLTQIAHEGGRAHGLLNVTPDDFFSLKITIPAFEEQIAIAQVLSIADNEIKLFKNKLDKLKEQKKGLMQQLLTGKKRIKSINSNF
jgi:type I restriction enzyme S subunit